jgi:tetratricopeptide (TPR) repeat protein
MTRRHMRLLSLCALLGLLAGCAADPFQAAVEDEHAGRWESAYANWGQAVSQAEAAGAGDADLAVRHYELGRAAGATCRFEEAERELLRANQLDTRTNGPTYMSLFELASMAYDRGQWTKAILYYESGFSEIERIQGKNSAHPAATAQQVDEYAIALRKAGRQADADAARKHAIELRQLEPKARIVTDRTPYGNYCAHGTP